MQLSKNFTLEEFLASKRAQVLDIDNSLPADKRDAYIANGTALCQNVLQPIRDHIDIPMTIISGYRCPMLNLAVQGEQTSQHLIMEAADVTVDGMLIPDFYEHIKVLVKGGLIVDQCIYEKRNTEWVHVSYTTQKTNRCQFLRGVRTGNVWHYIQDSI